MKKVIALILAAVLLCGSAVMLSSCGSSEGGEKKELHMATNAFFEPYEFYEGKEVVGIDAELAKAICDKLGYELVIDDMDFDAIITSVTSGKADFGMAGMTVTEDRLKSVDFSDTYTTSTQVIIVPDKDSKVANADDLEKATIGVQLGTTGDLYASDLKDAKIERYKKGADAVLALTSSLTIRLPMRITLSALRRAANSPRKSTALLRSSRKTAQYRRSSINISETDHKVTAEPIIRLSFCLGQSAL